MAGVFFDLDVRECNSLSLIANEPEIISGSRSLEGRRKKLPARWRMA
jgi:hypothetical protein